MKIDGHLCPSNKDGRHKLLPWAGDNRSGLACVRCSKTWEWRGKELEPTWKA